MPILSKMHPWGSGQAFAGNAAHLGCIEQHGDLDAPALPERQSRLQMTLINCCLHMSYLQQPIDLLPLSGIWVSMHESRMQTHSSGTVRRQT